MARRFNEYRVVDGRTRFAASDMNPRFEDIDQRLHAQEVLEKDFKGAIREVTDVGIERIDSFIGPAEEELQSRIGEAQQAVDAAQQAVQDAQDALEALNAQQFPISQIDGLQPALEALNAQQFPISQIDGLQPALDAGQDAAADAQTAARNGVLITLLTRR